MQFKLGDNKISAEGIISLLKWNKLKVISLGNYLTI